MLKLTSCDPGVFGRIFEGTFTSVLSGLCHSMPFDAAWRKAIKCCEGIEDIVCPRPDQKTGEYISRSGKKYVFGAEHPEHGARLFSVEFPPETCLDIEACLRSEHALVGHDHCVTLEIETC